MILADPRFGTSPRSRLTRSPLRLAAAIAAAALVGVAAAVYVVARDGDDVTGAPSGLVEPNEGLRALAAERIGSFVRTSLEGADPPRGARVELHVKYRRTVDPAEIDVVLVAHRSYDDAAEHASGQYALFRNQGYHVVHRDDIGEGGELGRVWIVEGKRNGSPHAVGIWSTGRLSVSASAPKTDDVVQFYEDWTTGSPGRVTAPSDARADERGVLPSATGLTRAPMRSSQ